MEKILKRLERYFGRFEYGVYKEAQDPDDKGAVWTVKPTTETTRYLKAMNAQGKHIFVRPTFEREHYYLMCDDHSKQDLKTHHKVAGKWKPGRLIVETSPGNYQIWIRADRPLSIEEKSYWLNKMGSDPGASPRHRWGRAPGFRNRKDKYRTDEGYPLAKLVWVDWKGRAVIPKAALPKPEIEQKTDFKTPKVNRNHSGEFPVRADFERGDNSATDFSYAMALLRRGVDRREVEQRIRSERTDWRHHKGERAMADYFKRTLDKAEDIVGCSRADNSPRQRQRGRFERFGRDQAKQGSEPEGPKKSLSQAMSI